MPLVNCTSVDGFFRILQTTIRDRNVLMIRARLIEAQKDSRDPDILSSWNIFFNFGEEDVAFFNFIIERGDEDNEHTRFRSFMGYLGRLIEEQLRGYAIADRTPRAEVDNSLTLILTRF